MSSDARLGAGDSPPDAEPAGLPEFVWVRHRGRVCQVSPWCPDSRPYNTVVGMRLTTGRPLDAGAPVTVQNMVDLSTMTVSGAGTSPEDPLFCEEMETRELGQCRCPDAAARVHTSRTASAASAPVAVTPERQ